MNLRDYLDKSKITQEEFAKLIDYCRLTVSRACNGGCIGRRAAMAIERATQGKVPYKELITPRKVGKS